VIVATAGHVNHGKTTLVRALTGVDTDRLPEEKRRGLSIELGFAYRPSASGGVLGFVDVPGHERFVRHMLAGVASIDFALLVVAADDGPMPQTREHVAILDLLQVPMGAVALTKVDRANPQRVAEVAAAVTDLLAGGRLAGAPVFPFAAPSGAGAAELLGHLERCAAALAPKAASGAFRLSIDRRFSLPGAGLIVAGAAVSGEVAVGDRLTLAPAGLAVRVRGLHVNGAPAERASAGARCAFNIVPLGQRRIEVERGDWLVSDGAALSTRRIDARVCLTRDAPGPVRDARVHLHLGAAEVAGRIAALEGEAIAPGGAALAQLLLDREIGAWWGDRFVLRDAAARRTLGGGTVIDPEPPARGRRSATRLAQLAASELPSAEDAFAALIARSPGGVALPAFRRGRGLSEAEWLRIAEAAPIERAGPPAAERAFARQAVKDWRGRILGSVASHHEREPESIGPRESEIHRALAPGEARPAFALALSGLLRGAGLVRDGGHLRLPDWRPALGGADARLWLRVEPLLEAGGLRPPRLREIAERLEAPLGEIEALLRRAARLGLVAQISANRAFPRTAVRRLAAVAESLAVEASDGLFTAALFRDRSGVGRNLTIEIIEHFDRAGFTRRVGEARRIVRPADEAFGPLPVAAQDAVA